MGRAAMIGAASKTVGAADGIFMEVSCTQTDCVQMEIRDNFRSVCNLKEGRCICFDDLDCSPFQVNCSLR